MDEKEITVPSEERGVAPETDDHRMNLFLDCLLLTLSNWEGALLSQGLESEAENVRVQKRALREFFREWLGDQGDPDEGEKRSEAWVRHELAIVLNKWEAGAFEIIDDAVDEILRLCPRPESTVGGERVEGFVTRIGYTEGPDGIERWSNLFQTTSPEGDYPRATLIIHEGAPHPGDWASYNEWLADQEGTDVKDDARVERGGRWRTVRGPIEEVEAAIDEAWRSGALYEKADGEPVMRIAVIMNHGHLWAVAFMLVEDRGEDE